MCRIVAQDCLQYWQHHIKSRSCSVLFHNWGTSAFAATFPWLGSNWSEVIVSAITSLWLSPHLPLWKMEEGFNTRSFRVFYAASKWNRRLHLGFWGCWKQCPGQRQELLLGGRWHWPAWCLLLPLWEPLVSFRSGVKDYQSWMSHAALPAAPLKGQFL